MTKKETDQVVAKVSEVVEVVATFLEEETEMQTNLGFLLARFAEQCVPAVESFKEETVQLKVKLIEELEEGGFTRKQAIKVVCS